MNTESQDQERRLFFSTAEDLYFLTYNLLILLDALGATPKSPLRDVDTLPILITFVADSALLELLERRSGKIPRSSRDYQLLLSAESRARRKRPFVARLLFALHRRELIVLADQKSSTTVALSTTEQLREFLQSDLFEQERINGQRLRKLLPRGKMMSAETVHQRLFQDRGVQTWHT